VKPGGRVLRPSDPDPITPLERKAPAGNYGDSFESWDGRPSEVRTLVTVGRIRLGVTRVSKVRDEKRVTALLEELGQELDQREQRRSDSFEARAIAYGPMLDQYGARLRDVMDGDFAFHAGSWALFHPAVAP
jgi:hypothetical protein